MAVCRLFRALQVEVPGPNPEGTSGSYIIIWRCLFCFVIGRTSKWTKSDAGLPSPPNPKPETPQIPQIPHIDPERPYTQNICPKKFGYFSAEREVPVSRPTTSPRACHSEDLKIVLMSESHHHHPATTFRLRSFIFAGLC